MTTTVPWSKPSTAAAWREVAKRLRLADGTRPLCESCEVCQFAHPNREPENCGCTACDGVGAIPIAPDLADLLVAMTKVDKQTKEHFYAAYVDIILEMCDADRPMTNNERDHVLAAAIATASRALDAGVRR